MTIKDMEKAARLKITKNSAGKGYGIPQLKIQGAKLSEIGSLIREGYAIQVQTADGYDYTKEMLTKIALVGVLHPQVDNDIIQALSEIIDQDLLYLIIENGGINNYLSRKARNAVFTEKE